MREWLLIPVFCLRCRGIVRTVGKVNQVNAQADAPSAVIAAMHDVEECLVANLVEIQRAAADGVASKTLQTLLLCISAPMFEAYFQHAAFQHT